MTQKFIGIVIGTAMQKTAKVLIDRNLSHPKTGRLYNSKKNYLAHDELEEAVIGDIVAIESCRPISKRKSFKLVSIVQPARRFIHPATGSMYTAH